jgi:hypothetical protein
MPDQLLEITFYGLCIAQGLVGWTAFVVAISDEGESLVQGAYALPTIAPVRRLLMSAMGWSLMFACALAWIAPMWTVALTWAGLGFAVANLFVPAAMQYGWKGVTLLSRDVHTWASLGVRLAVAAFLAWQAPRMIAS